MPQNSFRVPLDHPDVPAIAARYRTLETLVVTDIDDHDDDWADEWRALPFSDRSGLNVPLVAGGRCFGNLGVAMATRPRVWLDDEIALVQRASETVAALLARQRLEASLRASEARLAALLDGSNDLLAVLDRDGTILYANGAVMRGLGYRPDEVVGINVATLVHPDDLAVGLERLSSLLNDEPTNMTTLRLIAADGSIGWWEISSGEMHNPVAGGKVLTCRNVTERRQQEMMHSRRVDHLRYAFEVAQTALDLDPPDFLKRLPMVCSALAAMLQVDFVYIDKIDETRAQLTNLAGLVSNGAVQTVLAGETMPFELLPFWISRLRRPDPIVERDARDSTAAWAVEKRAVMGPEGGLVAVGMSAAGELFGVLGVSMVDTAREWSDDDLTLLRIVAETVAHVLERARVDEALRSSEARFRSLSETAADLVMLLDADRNIIYASPSSMGLLGYTPAELLGRSARALVHPDDIGLLVAGAPTMHAGKAFTSETRVLRADGSVVWVENSTSAVIDPATGRPSEYRSSMRDITDRKRLEAELEHRALHDPLTGLGNRILLSGKLKAAADPGDELGELSVLLIDLDGFKEVNDTYGHAVGDDVLRIVSSRLAALTRPSDTLARTGGDEFVVLCPDTATAEAVAVGERIVRVVSQPLATNGIVVNLGASVGVAHHAGGGIDPDWLLIEADHAMYTAKRSGRGCVRVAGNADAMF